MAQSDDAVNNLREALKHSPDNIPLRLHLAETLMGLGRYDEAEKEYRLGLAASGGDGRFKIGLANAFSQQGKNSEALVIVEELIKLPDPPAKLHLLYSRLLYKAGDIERSVRQYKRAVEADPAVADMELANRLGIQAGGADADAESEVVDGKVRSSWEGSDDESTAEVERPKVNFAGVGGMEHLKDEIRMKIIHPLNHPELYKAYGKTVGGGIMMYGPPGCGKTHLARATAGEIKSSFIAVGINDVLDMWIGNSERNLHALFEQARRNRPCVLFFDEVDALAASRADMRGAGGRHLINQFLAEMDGINASNEGVLILAATNAPWHVDGAFRRPGRFDRILFVPPPDGPARSSILRVLTKGKPIENIDYDFLAKKTEGFSGADLKAIIDVAIEAKLKQAMKEGIPKPLTSKDLQNAAGTLRPSTKDWFSTARNYALYSNQGGTYDEILKYLKL
ncbi:MAG TPA: AAA family ATPase [Tepidisphaeraceae bacterium]|jgi:SpoVK/Ycf46/Vps4 family AAA+-type ATPase|nr:AAA family ATPase [Tepidisphaeraceae bacterium]